LTKVDTALLLLLLLLLLVLVLVLCGRCCAGVYMPSLSPVS